MDKTSKIVFLTIICLALIIGAYSYISNIQAEKKLFESLFEDNSHIRTEEFNRTFDIKRREFNEINISFLADLYEDNQLISLSDDIYTDYKKITDFFSLHEINTSSSIDTYIVESTLIGGSYMAGGNAYCTADDLISGEYRIPMIQAYSAITQPWILYGLNDVIFNDSTDYDNAELIEYYKGNEDISILSLYGTRFYNDWNTDEEINIARQTSASLANYILDNYSYDTLLNVSDQLKTEWLNSLGVDKEYIDEYEGLLHSFEYTKAQYYSMLVKSHNVKYYLNIFEDLANAKDVEEFIYKDTISKEYILEYLKNNVIENSQVMHYDAAYNYYIKENTISRAYDGTIYLGMKSAHLHEAMHIIIPGQGEGHWQYEGIAEYLSKYIYKNNYDSERFSESFQIMMEKIASGEYDINEYNMQIIKCYLQNDGGWETPEDIDFRLYADSVSYVTLFIDNDFGNTWCSTPIYDRSSIIEFARKPGDELSYAQALSFTAFLVDKYSIDTFIGFCQSGVKFDETFGEDYITLKAEWLDYLRAIGENE